MTRTIPLRRRRLLSALAAGGLAAASLSGCAARGLDFVLDERVEITAPGTNEEVRLPLEVRWTANGFDGTFAVFFDRTPMRPGRDVRALIPRDDNLCRADPTCPNADWLSARGVYLTEETSLTVKALPDLRASSRQKDRHEVIIVLLDEQGRRTGETAYIREFIVDRDED